MEIILIAGITGLIALNLYASYQCYQDIFPSREQRIAQILFIWAAPVLGAAIALQLLTKSQGRQGPGTYRKTPDSEELCNIPQSKIVPRCMGQLSDELNITNLDDMPD